METEIDSKLVDVRKEVKLIPRSHCKNNAHIKDIKLILKEETTYNSESLKEDLKRLLNLIYTG